MPPSSRTVSSADSTSDVPVRRASAGPGPRMLDSRGVPLVTWQDLAGWLYLYPLRWLSVLLPVGASRWLLRNLCTGYARLRPGVTRTVREAMDEAFAGRDVSGAPAAFAREFVARELRKAADDLLIRQLDLDQLQRAATVTGLEHLDAARADGRGVIVISGHFHANRLAKYFLRRQGYPMMSVRGRRSVSPFLGRFGRRYVAPAYHRFLAGGIEDELYARTPGLGVGLLRRLRENGIVNIHIDAALSSETYRLRLLHLSWLAPAGFLRLAELSGAPLVPMLCLGDSDGFKVRFEAPIRVAGRSSPEQCRQRLQGLLARLEEWILAHPPQWEIWTRLVGPDPYDGRR